MPTKLLVELYLLEIYLSRDLYLLDRPLAGGASYTSPYPDPHDPRKEIQMMAEINKW